MKRRKILLIIMALAFAGFFLPGTILKGFGANQVVKDLAFGVCFLAVR